MKPRSAGAGYLVATNTLGQGLSQVKSELGAIRS